MRNTFIILFCLFLSQFVKAQSYPCSSIVVGTFAQNPQPVYSPYYYGVYVQLDRAYDQAITVNGYWHDSDGPDVGASFSITVPAGSTTYSTNAYYSTSTSTEVFITSITPSLVTGSNVTYSTQGYFGTIALPVESNPNNPMEYIGSYHNAECMAMISTMDFSTATVSNVLSNVDGFLTSKGYSASSFDSWYNSAVSAGYFNITNISSYANDVDAYCNSLYTQGIIDLQVKNYLHSMFTVIDNYFGDNDLPTTNFSYSDAADQIISIENTILNDNTLSANDKNGLLGVASVLRFSGANWGVYLMNGGGGGGSTYNDEPALAPFSATYAFQGSNTHGPQVNMSAEKRRYFRFIWKKFWKADGVGAVGGFWGAVFGGGGLIVGILGGAIGGSAGYAIFGD